MAYSFELLYRGLEGQEQLDISTKDSSNGDRCGDFIDSYFAGTSTSCNNWGNIGCVRFWINPGLRVKGDYCCRTFEGSAFGL